MHSTDNLEDGYLGSGKILGYSRHKYGDENHIKEVVEYCSTRDELKRREREIVNEDLLKDPLNINLKYGGEGGWENLNDGSESHRKRCSRAASKRNSSLKNTEIAKLIAQKAILTKSKREYIFLPTLGFTGKKHSDETKNRLSKILSEKQTGEKNSQFGTVWVCSKSGPKKIKKEDLSEYINKGYVRGRKYLGD